MGITRRIELRGRNGRNAQLHDEKPSEFEIARAVQDVLWEGVVGGKTDFGHVDEDEVAALRVRVGETEFVEDAYETGYFGVHRGCGFGPEVEGVGALKGYGAGFLEGGDAAVADSGVGCGDGGDEVFGAD